MVTAAVCQSCSMPLEHPEDYGTNEGGALNDDFCLHCYQEGAYTAPDMSIDDMAAIVVKYMDVKDQEAARVNLVDLKRWQEI